MSYYEQFSEEIFGIQFDADYYFSAGAPARYAGHGLGEPAEPDEFYLGKITAYHPGFDSDGTISSLYEAESYIKDQMLNRYISLMTYKDTGEIYKSGDIIPETLFLEIAGMHIKGSDVLSDMSPEERSKYYVSMGKRFLDEHIYERVSENTADRSFRY